MKLTLQFVLIIFCHIISYGQGIQEKLPSPKYPTLFKTLIPISGQDALWIKEMYSEDPNIFEIQNAFENYYATNPFIKTVHTQNYKHFIKIVKSNHYYDDNGVIDIKPSSNAEQQISNYSNAIVQSGNWTCIGPFDTYDYGGINKKTSQTNIYTIDQSIQNGLIMLAGSETGAVFKSIDKGENWNAIGDTYFNDDAIEMVKIDPTNSSIFYVSTRNALHKSIDGGVTWISVLSNANLSIYEMAIHPTNNQILFTAGNNGLIKSSNGGASWTTVFSDICWDIKFKTNDPNTLFLIKKNTTKNISEFYKSTDGGSTFTLKSNGWYAPTGGSAINDGGSKIGLTNADANRIYVVVLGSDDSYAEDNNYIGIYKSTDAGENWTLPYDGDNNGSADNEVGGPYNDGHWCFSGFGNTEIGYDQGYYNLAIDVSDTDPNKFLVGMLNLFKSENGGVSYTNWGGYSCTNCTDFYRHPDHQDILINGPDVWVATDGGIDKYDANLNIITSKNKGINGSSYWGIGQGWNEDIIVGGRYHIGNAVFHDNYPTGSFISLGGGEAASGYVNQGDNSKVYHSDISGKKVTSNFTAPITNITSFSLYPNESYFNSEKSEVVNDPRYFNHLYLGKDNNLWKSMDGGASFNLVYAFGTLVSNKIRGIEISRNNPNLIYLCQKVGNSAKLWKSINAGISWTEIAIPSTNQYMTLSLNENDVLFIAFNNGINSTNKIFKSVNGGSSWTNLTTPILNGNAIEGVQVQNGTNDGVYLYSDNKNIWYRNNSHSDWQSFNTGLPANTKILTAIPFYKKGKLRMVGTRGIWESDLFESSLPIAQPMVSQKTIDCHRTTIQFEDYSILNHQSASWQWSFPGATTVSSTSIRNPIVTYASAGNYTVSLTITDGNGNTNSKTIPNMIEVLPSTCEIETEALNAIQFNDDYDQVTNNTVNESNVINLTVTAWIKPDGIQNDYTGIITLGSDADNKCVFNFQDNNKIGYHWNGNYWWENTGLSVPIDEWSFVVMRVTPTEITLFVNDKKWTVNHKFTSVELNQFILGKYYDWSGRSFKGQMEEVSIWKKALTDDEILLGRHLIKQNTNDNDLVSYYQFNQNSSGFIYDKKNVNDFVVSGTVSLVNSTAPIAIGTSQLININAAGNYNFGNANANLNFSNAGPNGKIVVSKLNANPINSPSINSVSNEYWILNNYGTNVSFTTLNTLQLISAANLTGFNATDLKLYQRPSNSFLHNEWIEAATATSIIPLSTIQFSGSTINGSNQFYVGSDVSLGINQNMKPEITIYPNPIINGNMLKFININEEFLFSLYNTEGKSVLKTKINLTENQEINNLSTGMYFYHIETVNKMYGGKLIIK